MQWVLLVVAKHLKHDGFVLDVLNERLCDLHWNLLHQRQKESSVFGKYRLESLQLCVSECVCEHLHSGRGKSPGEILSLHSSEAL